VVHVLSQGSLSSWASLVAKMVMCPSDNSFLSVRQEPSFGPWKGSAFLQQVATLVGFFFAETDILTTRGTQGPACLPMDQTQQPQLGPFCPWSPADADNWPECPDWQGTRDFINLSPLPSLFLLLNPSYPSPFF